MKRRVVYIVVTDLHKSEKNLENRFNYVIEVVNSIRQLLNVLKKYDDCDEIYILWLGDIFHHSYKIPNESGADVSLMSMISDYVDGMYSVIGNHELNFYRDNPFWNLVHTIESTSVRSIMNKNWQPQGYKNMIHVPDYLQCGDSVFYFNHNSCPIIRPKAFGERISIGLFHHPICTRGIYTDMLNSFGVKNWEEDIIDFQAESVFSGYDYAMMAHLHSVYGKWVFDTPLGKTHLYHLASHGRTAHTEVVDTFLERNFPAFVFEDNGDGLSLLKVEDNLYLLPNRASTVKSEVVVQNAEKYKSTKTVNKVRNFVLPGEEPVDNVLTRVGDNPLAVQLLTQLKCGETLLLEAEISELFQELQ